MLRLNKFLKDRGMVFLISAYQDYGGYSKIYHITFIQYLFDDIFFTIEMEDNIMGFGFALEETLIKFGIKANEETS